VPLRREASSAGDEINTRRVSPPSSCGREVTRPGPPAAAHAKPAKNALTCTDDTKKDDLAL